MARVRSFRPAPGVEHVFGDSTLHRLEVEEIPAIHIREYRGDDGAARRIDDPDIVAEQGRPITRLVCDRGARTNALRESRRIELLAKDAQHLLCRRLAGELTALQLLEESRDLACGRPAEPLRRICDER